MNLENNSILSNDSVLNSSIESDDNYENESEVLKYYSTKVLNIEGNSQKLRKTLILDSENASFCSNNNLLQNNHKRRDAFSFINAQSASKSPRNFNSKSLNNNNDKLSCNDYSDTQMDLSRNFLNEETELNNNKSLFTNLTDFQQTEILDFLQEITNELDNMFKILNKYVGSNLQKAKKIKCLKSKILNIYEKYNTLKLDFTCQIEEKNKVLTVYEEVIDCLDKEKNQLNEKITEIEKNFNSGNFNIYQGSLKAENGQKEKNKFEGK